MKSFIWEGFQLAELPPFSLLAWEACLHITTGPQDHAAEKLYSVSLLASVHVHCKLVHELLNGIWYVPLRYPKDRQNMQETGKTRVQASICRSFREI